MAAATKARRLSHKPAVWRRTDTDGKQAAVADTRTDFRKQRLLITHRAVGNEDHLAQGKLFLQSVGRPRCFQRGAQGGQHFSTAVCAQPVHKFLRLLQVAVSGCHRLAVKRPVV